VNFKEPRIMSNAFPYKSTQLVAATAVVLALLGGAYAVGRSQGPSLAPEMSDSGAAPQAHRGTEPAPAARHEVALCDSCGVVTDVHSESHRGQATGVGAVGGAVVGGLLGSAIGGGSGKKLATVAGAAAGGYAGNEIEKRERSHSVWIVQIKDRDGRIRRFERAADPGLRLGDEVTLRDGGFSLR
jgi:outer membrane lipoprotein SlyB